MFTNPTLWHPIILNKLITPIFIHYGSFVSLWFFLNTVITAVLWHSFFCHNEANKLKILAHSFTSDLLLFWSSVDPGLRDGKRGSDIVIWSKFINLRGSKFAIFESSHFCHNEANKLKIFTRSFYNWFVAFLIKCGSSNSRWNERE